MVSSVLTKEQQALVKPDENLMFEREGFDRQGIRREFAPVETIDPSTKYIEQGNVSYVHPDSDMPRGPTAEGESFGNIELVREVGGNQQIPRYTNGFTVDIEDTEVSNSWLMDARDGIMELFDIQADLAFLLGLQDEAGNDVFTGVFEWLDNNVPADNIIDCSTFDPSAGDLQGVPANIVAQEAYQRITGEYVTTTWDLAVAKHPVWAYWNQLGTFDGAMVESQWELMQADDNEADIGVGRRVLVPQDIGLRGPTDMDEGLQFDITFPTRTNSAYDSPVGDIGEYTDDDDVMYLIPQHGGDFYELYEQATPDTRGPLPKEGFRERWEYKWRAGVVQGQSFKADGAAVDAVKLENVSALFD